MLGGVLWETNSYKEGWDLGSYSYKPQCWSVFLGVWMETDVVSYTIINNQYTLSICYTLLRSLQASHLRDLGTNVTLPVACIGSCNAAVIADAQLTRLTEISAVEDQPQSLQAASTLSLPQLLGSTRTFMFDLQQLILQLPVGQKQQNIKHIRKSRTRDEHEFIWWCWSPHRILFSSRFLNFSSFCSTFRIISLSFSRRKERFRSSPTCSIGLLDRPT